MLALTPEGSVILEAKAEGLRGDMETAKRESAVRLMGRKELPTLDQAKAAEKAAAAADTSVSC